MASTAATPDDAIMSHLYDVAQSWLSGHEEPGPANIIAFATVLMAAAQRLKADGPAKKAAVLAIMKKIVSEFEYKTPEDKAAVLLLVDTLVPPAIDEIKNVATQLGNTSWPCCK